MQLKINQLPVRSKFSEVKSIYKLGNEKERYIITLTDNEFSASHFVKNNDEWLLRTIKKVEGSLEKVQKKCMKYIESISKKI